MDAEQLKNYVNFVNSLSKEKLLNERMEVLELINGEVFFRIREWPKKYQLMFWEKPLSDKSAFQVLLFLIGNGCPPVVAQKWIGTSLVWSRWSTAQKRVYQIQWVMDNIKDAKYRRKWFYFDLHENVYLYLSGEKV